jgi:tyrosinase
LKLTDGSSLAVAALPLRKEIDELSAVELAGLRAGYAGMQAISDNRGFNYLSGLHGIPGNYCVHYDDPPLFLPWHRAYLHEFEQYLQDRAETATVPWWDWTIDRGGNIPQAFAAPQSPDGSANPLYASQINQPTANPPIVRQTQRFPMTGQPLPDPSVVTNLVALTDFEDFSTQLRGGVHNQLHGWTGGMGMVGGRRTYGDMAVVPVAAFDPIFYSHHCMIDRIWYLWQLQNGVTNIPQAILNTVLPPFNVKVADVLDIHQLGYDYAIGATTTSGSTP